MEIVSERGWIVSTCQQGSATSVTVTKTGSSVCDARFDFGDCAARLDRLPGPELESGAVIHAALFHVAGRMPERMTIYWAEERDGQSQRLEVPL